MVIVRDIQDASTMYNALKMIQRRAHTFAKSRDGILMDIGSLMQDLEKNIIREERKIEVDKAKRQAWDELMEGASS